MAGNPWLAHLKAFWAKNKGKIFIGFSTHHRNGGFAGKYVASTEITTEPGEIFELEIPIEDFKPEEEKFPASPVGMEMIHWWAVSFDENSGLQVIDAELTPNQFGFL